ncbi:hypothetical protein [Streptomyces sp. NPDC007007]|uniref:hypothetical protein n=1 Tax=Streptomyces sp. NPDC007007 TaxID=3364770 RepID=UPI0036C870A0
MHARHDALRQQALIESSVAIHRDHTVQEQLIASVDSEYGTVLDTAQNLVNGATRSIDIVHTRRVSSPDRIASACSYRSAALKPSSATSAARRSSATISVTGRPRWESASSTNVVW